MPPSKNTAFYVIYNTVYYDIKLSYGSINLLIDRICCIKDTDNYFIAVIAMVTMKKITAHTVVILLSIVS